MVLPSEMRLSLALSMESGRLACCGLALGDWQRQWNHTRRHEL